MAHKISYSDFENTTNRVILASSTETHKKLTLITEFGNDPSLYKELPHYYEVSSSDVVKYETLDLGMAIKYYNKI